LATELFSQMETIKGG